MRRVASVPSIALLASLSGLAASEAAAAPPPGLDDLLGEGGVEHGVAPVRINEIRIDQPGTDNEEYIELVGVPGTSLTGLHYIIIGDNPTGLVETVINLNGRIIPPDGTFVMGKNTLTLAVPDFLLTAVALNLENQDTVTHMLVAGFTGTVNVTNIDPNADGIPDVTPWVATVDVVAILGPAGELPYGPGATCTASDNCQTVDPPDPPGPGHLFRCPDATGTWVVGNFDHLAAPTTDTPGAANHCACGDSILVPGEVCDTGGSTATCDDDCTLPS